VLAELQQTGLVDAWLRRRIEQAIAPLGPLEHLRRSWFAAAATSLFLQRRPGLDHVLISGLRLSDAELAQELYFSLLAAEVDFPQLAHLSQGPERLQGGRIGPIPLGQLQPLVAEQLRRATPLELLPPLELDNGQLLILRLEQIDRAVLTPTLQRELEQELFEQWLAAEQARLLPQLEGTAGALSLQLPDGAAAP
jgi:hypothetical protein